jgi:hypothetical protein
MKFPAGILPSAQYTLFYVARYNGPTRGRIFQGVGTNWFSGFWDSKAGIAYHGSCLLISSSADLHGSDWVVGSDRSDSFRSNGVDRSVQNSCLQFDRLAINAGANSGQSSDFAIQSILVYNVKLSDADVQRVEAWLNTFQPAFTPANLQASACVHNQSSLWVSSTKQPCGAHCLVVNVDCSFIATLYLLDSPETLDAFSAVNPIYSHIFF